MSHMALSINCFPEIQGLRKGRTVAALPETSNPNNPCYARGCACSQLDDDADGVSNCTDDCPDTSLGEGVDDDGCPVAVDNPPTNDDGNDNANDGDAGAGQPVPEPGDGAAGDPSEGDAGGGDPPPPVDETPGQDQTTTETPSRSPSRSTCGSFGFGSIALLIGGSSFLILTRRKTLHT